MYPWLQKCCIVIPSLSWMIYGISIVSHHSISYWTALLRAVPFHIVPFRIILFHIVSYCFVSCHFISNRFVSYCFVTYCFRSYRTILYCAISYHTASCCTVSYHTISYLTVSDCTVSYRNVYLYYIVPYCILLYCLVSHRIISCCIVSDLSISWVTLWISPLIIRAAPRNYFMSFLERLVVFLSCGNDADSLRGRDGSKSLKAQSRKFYLLCTLRYSEPFNAVHIS